MKPPLAGVFVCFEIKRLAKKGPKFLSSLITGTRKKYQ
uniref:Uncharacterized protein n=1 Tax=Tetranychus urticae TaxID=32264 RepID=T1KKG7_TETUR